MTTEEFNALAHKVATLAAWHACHGFKGNEHVRFDAVALEYKAVMDEQVDAAIAGARETLERSAA